VFFIVVITGGRAGNAFECPCPARKVASAFDGRIAATGKRKEEQSGTIGCQRVSGIFCKTFNVVFRCAEDVEFLFLTSLYYFVFCDLYYPHHTTKQGHWNIHELLEQNNGDWQFVLSSLKKMSPPVKEEVGDV